MFHGHISTVNSFGEFDLKFNETVKNISSNLIIAI